jgi:GntR family transcriptional regulator/MocR family aminotransferase
MLKTDNTPAPFVTLALGQSSAPLHRRLYEALRGAILSGQFGAQSRLPSTRFLAKQLHVSRMTVVNAYEQLHAEGYIEGKIGSGSYVASTLPEQLLQTHSKKFSPGATAPDQLPPRAYHLSKRGAWLAKTTAGAFCELNGETFRAFGNGYPAIDEFPFDVWSRLAARRLRHPPSELLGYGHPAGYRPLRESVAAYLRTARAVRCEADQVFIVDGAQQALDLVARVLLDADDPVWVEDPCYLGARGALTSTGAKLIPVPVDGEGFNLPAALKLNKQARLVYVTPSHQYPLGMMMSLGRRLALLEWAGNSSALIIEDDYNSEFRYAGRPLASL